MRVHCSRHERSLTHGGRKWQKIQEQVSEVVCKMEIGVMNSSIGIHVNLLINARQVILRLRLRTKEEGRFILSIMSLLLLHNRFVVRKASVHKLELIYCFKASSYEPICTCTSFTSTLFYLFITLG